MTKITLVVFLLTIFNAALSELNQTEDQRIIGGNNAEKGQFPFVVSIHSNKKNYHISGGAIIHKIWIVTSARFIKDFPSTDLTVYAGLLHQGRYDRTQIIPVEEVILHPDFKNVKGVYIHDIALLRLRFELKLNNFVQTVNLPGGDDDTMSGKGFTLGWGQYQLGEYPKYHPTLQYAVGRITNQQKCEEMFREAGYNIDLSRSHICLKARKAVLCHDDSGPMISEDDVLIGIASMWKDNCNSDLPIIYTYVKHHLDFIGKYAATKDV